MKPILPALLVLLILSSCQDEKTDVTSNTIASGQMPNIARDHSGNIHLVYGSGDSLLYSWSSDKGKTFSAPALIAVLPRLTAAHTRGPQIAATSDGLTVTACTAPGDI